MGDKKKCDSNWGFQEATGEKTPLKCMCQLKLKPRCLQGLLYKELRRDEEGFLEQGTLNVGLSDKGGRKGSSRGMKSNMGQNWGEWTVRNWWDMTEVLGAWTEIPNSEPRWSTKAKVTVLV